MATIGQALTSPETGWKRIDDKNNGIFYHGSFGVINGEDVNLYNATGHQTDYQGANIKFKFSGTKLRIISWTRTDFSSNISINIDGQIENYNLTYGASTLYQQLVYEKQGLSNNVHSVTITNQTATTMNLDAIDIDDTGDIIVVTLDNMQIGDAISCEYVATSGAVGTFSNLGLATKASIPTTSSATPNGSFYFVHAGYDHKGRMKLVADRNIQHTITWDKLNTAGIISEKEIKFYSSLVPIMTSDTNGSIKLASSSFSGTNNPYKLFDTDVNTSWIVAVGNLPAWMSVDFGELKKVCKYTITARTSYQSQAPKAWTFEGWDGNAWVVLNTQTNQTFTSGETKNYEFTNDVAYAKYRINISSQNGDATYMAFAIMQLFESVDYNSQFTIRLLTGGLGTADKNNEWDKIIVESNLNSTITTGDNNIWNWNGIYTMASTSVPSSRVMRGSTASNTWSSATSSTANTTTGFRPVLLVESLDSSKNRFLILDNGKYKTIIDGVLTVVCNETDIDEVKIEAFNQGLLTPNEFIPLLNSLESTTIKLLRFLAPQ